MWVKGNHPFKKMVAISYSSSSNEHQHQVDNQSVERRVILIGFDSDRAKAILADKAVTKLVIFDDTDNARPKFEKVYPIYRDRITLYEGAVESNLNAYFKLREKEGINPETHRLEVHNNHFRLFNIV
jgi:hypothetical protein